MKLISKSGTLTAGLLLTGSTIVSGAQGNGPDVTAMEIGGPAGEFQYAGRSGEIAAYFFATTACNSGTQAVNWSAEDHPVIAQNFYRLKDGLFEQIGLSWVAHASCAENDPGCGICQPSDCSTLGVGCATTNSAVENDGRFGGPRGAIDPLSGLHLDPMPSPTGPEGIRGRLQVAVDDIDPARNPGAVYFAEAQYVSAHDAQMLNGSNNNSWRKLDVQSPRNISADGPTHVGEPATYAWKAEDPGVNIVEATSAGEGGFGVDATFSIAYRVTELPGPKWHYVYVVQNLNSRRGCASFSIPMPPSITVTDVYFNDVDHHSGEAQEGTDWGWWRNECMLRWEVDESWRENPNANALRWGTLYTFSLVADGEPLPAPSEIGLFEPGIGVGFTVPIASPVCGPVVGTPFCFGDGSGSACPCANSGDPGHGCANGSSATGTRLSAAGSASIAEDMLFLLVAGAVPNETGLFYQADNQIAGGDGLPFGDGLRCAGGGVVRLEVATSNDSGRVQSGVSIAGNGGANPGDAKNYQYWYRDPSGSPCGSSFNFSSGLEIVWMP